MRAEVLNEWVTLIEGDNRAAMELIDRAAVDALVSDPPYGMSWNTDITRFTGGHDGRRRSRGLRSPRNRVEDDDRPFDPAPWLGFPRVVLFGFNHFAARLPVGTTLVWVKKQQHAYGTFLSDAELAWMKGGHGVYLHLDQSMNAETWDRRHPTQKPIGLMKWCIEKAKVPAGGLILDPYAGSGSTALAAMLTGRRCIVVESDARYCDVIRRRVEQVSGDGPGSLFHAPANGVPADDR